MMISASEDLAAEAASELGADVAYLRFSQTDKEDRRYLTGVEVALIAGTAALAAFWKGFFEGAGKKAGERAAEFIIDRLDRVRRRLRGEDLSKADELPRLARQGQGEIDASVREALARRSQEELRTLLEASVDEQVAEVRAYLEDVGLPPDRAAEDARRISGRIRETLLAS